MSIRISAIPMRAEARPRVSIAVLLALAMGLGLGSANRLQAQESTTALPKSGFQLQRHSPLLPTPQPRKPSPPFPTIA
jgi:hypothetical protein